MPLPTETHDRTSLEIIYHTNINHVAEHRDDAYLAYSVMFTIIRYIVLYYM